MKIMAGYDPEAKPNYKQQTNEELEKIQRKTILLNDMLNSVKVGERIGVGDIFEELSQACKAVQPKIQKFISEEEDTESIDRLLTLNDLINTVLKRYENVKNGIFEQPEEKSQPLPPQSSITNASASESLLIDLGNPDPPQGQIQITDDLFGLNGLNGSSNETSEKGNAIDDLLGLSFN